MNHRRTPRRGNPAAQGIPPHRCRAHAVHTCAGEHHFVWCYRCHATIDVVGCDHVDGPAAFAADELEFRL